LTATVQDDDDPITVPSDAPDRLKLEAPGVAVTVPPVQVVVGLGVGATTNPEGKGSVIDSPVNKDAPKVRVIVTVIRVTLLRTTVAGEKVLDAVTGATTEMAAVAATGLFPRFV
jgi:hypothetical protein